MTSSSANKTPNSPSEGKSGGKVLSQCSYCDMSFKKLEHAQRHERTHSGVRPYTCPFSSCGKSFARQDTLRRHARLHNRKEDDSKPAKGRRRRISVSSTGTARSEASDEPTTPRSPVVPLYSTSLPSPTFHSFSRTHHGPSSTNNIAAGGQVNHTRRYSDASYPSLTGLSLDLSSHTILEDPLQFGTGKLPFELMATSPAGSTTSSSSEGDDSNDGTYSQSDKVESQYPSPAFTSYSPSALNDTTMTDLEAILANDPLHASMSASSRQKATSTHSAGNEDDFDFEQFATSVEGPTHSDVTAYDNLLGLGNMTSAINIEPYPTPRVASQPIPTFHNNFSLDFDFPSVKLVEEQQRLAREQQQKKSQNRPSLSMPSLTMPSLATMTNQNNRPALSPSLPSASAVYPSTALASAYASSFPSLSVMPNTLGLHSAGGDGQSAESILYAAYLKRKGVQQQQQHLLQQQQQQQQQVALPAFYVPSNAQGRLQVPIPSWSPNARDALHETREPGALFVV